MLGTCGVCDIVNCVQIYSAYNLCFLIKWPKEWIGQTEYLLIKICPSTLCNVYNYVEIRPVETWLLAMLDLRNGTSIETRP